MVIYLFTFLRIKSEIECQPTHARLKVEEPFFAVYATGVSDQPAIGTYYAVTGDDDPEFILAIGGACGANAFGIAEGSGELHIGDSLPIGYSGEVLPDALLKGCAL